MPAALVAARLSLEIEKREDSHFTRDSSSVDLIRMWASMSLLIFQIGQSGS